MNEAAQVISALLFGTAAVLTALSKLLPAMSQKTTAPVKHIPDAER